MGVRKFTGDLDKPKVKKFTGELDQEKIETEPEKIPITTAGFTGPVSGEVERGMIESQFKDIEAVKKGAAEAAPIAGATIGSMLFPPAAAPAAATKLPMLLKMAGSAARAIPTITAAGAGGAVGGGAKEALLNQEATLSDIGGAALKSGKEMAMAEALGMGVGAVAQKAFAPVASKITEKGAELLKFAKQYKLPFMPSRLTGSTMSKAIEGGTDSILGGRLVNSGYRRLMVTRFNQVADDIPKSVGDVMGNEIIARQARQEFGDLVSTATMEAKARVGQFLQTIPKGGNAASIKVSTFKPLLKNIKAQAKSPAIKRFVNEELDQIGRNIIKRAEDLETTMRQLSSIRAKGADRKFITEMRNAIKKDFADAGANMKMLEESNKFFSKNKALLSSKTGRRLSVAEGKAGYIPDRAVTVEVFRSGNESLVKQLAEELPEQTWKNLKAQNIANMLDGVSDDITEMFGMRFINGSKLEKIIANNRGVFEATYDKATMKALDNLAALAKATGPEIRELIGKGGMAEAKKLASYASLGGAVEPFTGLVLPQGASMGFAQSLMNPNGILKKWLTVGIRIPKTKEGIKMGGRLVFDNGD